VASPGDTQEERDLLDRVVTELNRGIAQERELILDLIRWETHARPGVGADAQDVINRQIEVPDVFIGIFWKRLGTPTGRAPSGTAEEIERVLNVWRQVGGIEILIYFNQSPQTPTRNDLDELARLHDFLEELKEDGVFVWEYDGAQDFEAKVRGHLTGVVRGWSPEASVKSTTVDLPAQPTSPTSSGEWHRALAGGSLNVELDARARDRVNTLVSEVRAALKECAFGNRTVDRVAVVLLELLANVRQHADDSSAVIEIDVRTTYQRTVSIDVYHRGVAVDIAGVLDANQRRLHEGDHEHGLLKVARLAGHLHSSYKEEEAGRHGVGCYVYELEPLHSGLFREYAFAVPIAIEYDSPKRYWLGDDVHVTGQFEQAMRFAVQWATKPLLDLYFARLVTPGKSCLGVEVTGHIAPSEPAWEFENATPRAVVRSQDPVQAGIEAYFGHWFRSRRVVLFANSADFTPLHSMRSWAQRWNLDCLTDIDSCRARVETLAASPDPSR
jgi:anti-sigma regulatory factor (Ser/Thr protein kinase)